MVWFEFDQNKANLKQFGSKNGMKTFISNILNLPEYRWAFEF